MPTIDQQLTLFLSIYPRMSVQWRRNMLPTLRGWAATLNRCAELKLTATSYAVWQSHKWHTGLDKPVETCYIIRVVKGTTHMYNIQIQYNKEGLFERTVYHPMGFDKANKLIQHLRSINGQEHNYILVKDS